MSQRRNKLAVIWIAVVALAAVIFVKGKVDAITSGDTSKTVIEVRRR